MIAQHMLSSDDLHLAKELAQWEVYGRDPEYNTPQPTIPKKFCNLKLFKLLLQAKNDIIKEGVPPPSKKYRYFVEKRAEKNVFSIRDFT